MKYLFSKQSQKLSQSGIRAASEWCSRVGGINLGQGVCDLPIVDNIKKAATKAINKNKNSYSNCYGLKELRHLIAKKLDSFNKINRLSEEEVIVTHGSTGAFVCAIQALFNPEDEIILFEPFYGYHREILSLFNIKTNCIKLNLNDFSFNITDLERVCTKKTKGIIICTPNNPSGKVYTKNELEKIGKFAKANNLYVITDEIYEYITYPGHQHISLASMDEFRDITITISGFSKTYNMTGWRLGYAHAHKYIIEKIGLIQDLLYVCPATPLQHAVLTALNLQEEYYQTMCSEYLLKRDFVVQELRRLGFNVTPPEGAYYIMADISKLDYSDDKSAMEHILTKARVATVTGRSFYQDPQDGKNYLRFCFALSKDHIYLALEALKKLIPN